MKENFLNTKFRFSFQITSIKSFTEMKGMLLFQEHMMNFKITDAMGKSAEEKLKKKDIVRNIMKPIYFSESEDCFHLNYSLIKTVSFGENRINMEIFNPANPTNLTLVLFKMEKRRCVLWKKKK